MRVSNYSEFEIEQKRNRIEQFKNDFHRQVYLSEMFRLKPIGEYPYFIILKQTNEVIEYGHKWHSNSLEIAYNRLVIDLYEYEHRVYNDLF